MGLHALGVQTTLANSSYTPNELAHQLTDSAARLVFTHPILLPVLLETFKIVGVPPAEARKRIVLMSFVESDRLDEKAGGIGPEWTRLDSLLDGERLTREENFDGLGCHETAVLCYSSGTTGLSKVGNHA